MPQTIIQIGDAAARKVGGGAYTAGDGSRVGALISRALEPVLNALLEQHPWAFASKAAVLAPLGTCSNPDYTNEFSVPTDCLRLISVASPGRAHLCLGSSIFSDTDTLPVIYVRRLSTASPTQALFPDSFANAAASLLASEIAVSLTLEGGMKTNLEQQAARDFAKARFVDSQWNATAEVGETWVQAHDRFSASLPVRGI